MSDPALEATDPVRKALSEFITRVERSYQRFEAEDGSIEAEAVGLCKMPNLSIMLVRIRAGFVFPDHVHEAEERIRCLAGRVPATFPESTETLVQVDAGHEIVIPAGVVHGSAVYEVDSLLLCQIDDDDAGYVETTPLFSRKLKEWTDELGVVSSGFHVPMVS